MSWRGSLCTIADGVPYWGLSSGAEQRCLRVFFFQSGIALAWERMHFSTIPRASWRAVATGMVAQQAYTMDSYLSDAL